MNKTLFIAVLLAASVNTMAATTGDFLNDDSVAKADDSALAAEAGVFNTVSQGIAVSLARCAAEHCVPDVTKDELELLISKLNDRIGVLTSRFQESGDKQLEKILLSYASSRDSYNGYLDKLKDIAPAEQTKEEKAPEDKYEFKDEF